MQQLTLTVKFKVEQKPDRPEHLHEVVRNYLATKGITLLDDNTIHI